MTVTFFGTAGAVQSLSNTNTSFVVRVTDFDLLVDCSGSPVGSLLRVGVEPRSLGAVLLTHAHTDHIYAFPSLVHNLWLMGREKPLTVLGNRHTLSKTMELCAPLGVLSKKNLFPIRWVEQDDESCSTEPGCEITLFPVEHSVPTSGVRITADGVTLVYSCDTSPSSRVLNEARGTDTLIHEASGTAHRERELNGKGHSSGRQAGVQARNAGVQTLFLCHIDPTEEESPETIRQEAASEFTGRVLLPDRYLAYNIEHND